MSRATFPKLPSDSNTSEALYLAIEISDKSWLLGFATPRSERIRMRTMEADCVDELLWEIREARRKYGLNPDGPTIVAYEAGFSGFWLYRRLESEGFEVLLFPSTVLEDTTSKQRSKTDRLDVKELVRTLVRYHYYGEKVLFKPVPVPPAELEDFQRVHRERLVLKNEIGRHRNRIWGLLRKVGLRPNWKRGSSPIPDEGLSPCLRRQLEREIARLQLAQEQLKEVEKERVQAIKERRTPGAHVAERLMLLVGIGITGGWELAHEAFWRKFSNRRQVGSHAGLVSVKRSSGKTDRDLGISKRGNTRIRSLLVELSWLWLRHQPDSAISRWYRERFLGKRPRKIGIVAVARKLLIALWRYVEHGIVPEGARLKSQAVA